MIRPFMILTVACATACIPAYADFTYSQTTKITGGSMVRMMKLVPGGGKTLEPQLHTVMVQGNRMANISDKSVSVIDLDKETMTEINLEKKQYSVLTFAEFRQLMEAMQQKMGQQKKGEVSIEYKFDIKETGETKNVAGFNTKETQLLVTMLMKDPKKPDQPPAEIKMDMSLWLAPKVSGYDEVMDFHRRMAEKMGYSPEAARMGRMPMMQPGMGEGIARLTKEAAKMDGIPILTVMRMGGFGGPAGPEGEPGAPEMQTPNAGEVAKEEAGSSAGRAIGGRLGGLAGGALGGFGRKKKEAPKEDTPPPAKERKEQAPPQGGQAGGSMMETTTEMTSFSKGGVDPSKFEIPAGFKQVDNEMKKSMRDMK